MIIITGATGRLGSLIVERLLTRVPAEEVGVSVRDVAKARALEEQGVRVRHGDFTNPRGLAHAFEDAEQVLVVSAAIRGGSAVAANVAAINTARAVGAKRISYTSHQAASAASLFAPQVTHAATQRHLEQLGVPFTALRNGFYASTLAFYVSDAIKTGQLTLPDDGPVSWTAHTDLAEAAAVNLTTLRPIDGVTAPLTATEALTFNDVARMLSDIVGRHIERVVVSDGSWTESVIDAGMPPEAAHFTLGMFKAARNGEFAVTDPLLTSLIGEEPVPVQSVLAKIVTAMDPAQQYGPIGIAHAGKYSINRLQGPQSS